MGRRLAQTPILRLPGLSKQNKFKLGWTKHVGMQTAATTSCCRTKDKSIYCKETTSQLQGSSNNSWSARSSGVGEWKFARRV